MTAQEAYRKVLRKHPLERARSVLEFDNFFLFFMAPFYIADRETYNTGKIFPAVDKKTGKVFNYDITTDVDAYDRAKEASVRTIFDKKVNT